MSRAYFAPILCILAGLAVLAAAIVWPHVATPDPSWTAEKAESLLQAAEERQRLAQAPPSAANDEARLRAAALYDELLEQRNQALGGRVVLGMVLQMLGVGLGLVGSVWLILRQNQAEDQRGESG